MPVNAYLIDYNSANDNDGNFRQRLSELSRVADRVFRHAPRGGTKILVGPEAFFGTVPVDSYRKWDSINIHLERISKAAQGVLIVPGSMLWRWRGSGGNVCPVWYNGSKIMDVYKCYPAGQLDTLISVKPDGTVSPVRWRNRSFWRVARYDPADHDESREGRKSQVFEWEGHNVGVSVCNDFRQNIVLDHAVAKGVELDFHIVVSKVFFVQIPGDVGVNNPGNSNAVNHSQVRDQGYVIQCEGDAPAYPVPLAGLPNPPPSPPSATRKLFVCQKNAAGPGPVQFQAIDPDDYHQPAPAPVGRIPFRYIQNVVCWRNL